MRADEHEQEAPVQIASAKDWLNGGRDRDNAREWPLLRNIMTTAIVGGLAFTMFFAALLTETGLTANGVPAPSWAPSTLLRTTLSPASLRRRSLSTAISTLQPGPGLWTRRWRTFERNIRPEDRVPVLGIHLRALPDRLRILERHRFASRVPLLCRDFW